MLSAEHLSVIQATAPAVEANARNITEHFYPLMFERYPEVKAYFNDAHQGSGSQRQALANAVIAYAKNIERLEVLGDAVSLIAHKHCSLGIAPEHYPIVGECLLDAIAAVFQEAATQEVLEAWGAAYGQLADILIQAEAAIYQSNAERQGGWQGERTFTVTDKVQESDVITSLLLAPADGNTGIDFLPGQYIGLVMNIDGRTVRRNYSLSDAPGKEGLRISVKREPGGLVSNYLHDQVQAGDQLSLTAPCGDFVLRESTRPLFLVTAGVGLTPAISMLNHCVASGREIHFVHAAQNSRAHAFEAHVSDLARRYSNLKPFYIYDQPMDGDTPHAKGFINSDILEKLLPADRDVEFYFLGPKPFMKSVNALTQSLAIPSTQVHFEFFGPLEDLTADTIAEPATKETEAQPA